MDTIAMILSVIGCLNWGLVGIFRFDLVAWLFGGQGSLISRIVYTIVGLAGLWCIREQANCWRTYWDDEDQKKAEQLCIRGHNEMPGASHKECPSFRPSTEFAYLMK